MDEPFVPANYLKTLQSTNSVKNVMACKVLMYVNPIPGYIFMVMTRESSLAVLGTEECVITLMLH